MITRNERARGSLLGGAIGDALGAPVEFMSLREILSTCGSDGVTEMLPAFGLDGGAITDDTQMTLFAAEGLIQAAAVDEAANSVHAAFLRWYQTQGRGSADLGAGGLDQEDWLWASRAPGSTCMGSLGSGDPVGTAAINDSKGCGTVMRSAPFGFTSAPMTLATESSHHTHGHPTAAVSSAYLAQIIFGLLEGSTLSDAVTSTRESIIEVFPEHHRETTSIVDRAIGLAAGGPPSPEVVESLGGGWIAEEAFAISILCALTATSWSDALTRSVTHSGDSDSTGAITGNLLGAVWGDADLPAEWLRRLEGRGTIERVATELAGVDL